MPDQPRSPGGPTGYGRPLATPGQPRRPGQLRDPIEAPGPGRPHSPGQPTAFEQPRDPGQGPAPDQPRNPAEPIASGRPRPPGYDEIAVATPPAPALCSNAEHRRLYVLAEVVITFGELGTPWQKGAFWFHNWHKSFSLCQVCFDAVIGVARRHRPGLKIIGTTRPSTATTSLADTGPEPAGH